MTDHECAQWQHLVEVHKRFVVNMRAAKGLGFVSRYNNVYAGIGLVRQKNQPLPVTGTSKANTNSGLRAVKRGEKRFFASVGMVCQRTDYFIMCWECALRKEFRIVAQQVFITLQLFKVSAGYSKSVFFTKPAKRPVNLPE